MAHQLNRLADQLEPHVERLPGPSADDSPRTTNAWQRLFLIFHGANISIVEKHPDFLRLFDEDGDEEDPYGDIGVTRVASDDEQEEKSSSQEMEIEEDQAEEEEEEQKQETAQKKQKRKADAAHLAVIKRAQKIIGGLTLGNVGADDLAEAIAEPPALAAEKAEDLALTWLVRGFAEPSRDWHRILRVWTRDSSPSTREFLELSAQLDDNMDHMRRDVNLRHTQSATRTDTYLADLLYKIETLKCAAEWNSHKGPGAGAIKNAFNVALFQRENDAIFRNLTDSQKKRKMEEYSTEFTLFKKDREELVTARNRLWLAWENFGTAVLIHPFFSAPNLGQKRAKKFRSLLDVLISLAPPSTKSNPRGRNIFNDHETKNRGVLYTLSAALCESEEEEQMVAHYLDNFFIRYPSKIGT
ncbi:hypothetical protein B0H19DRAFT_1191919 [Mycena capillaripes]|nr:hypothetical protein B0H19DRAFT_1191919 [Mycena capillaripes]